MISDLTKYQAVMNLDLETVVLNAALDTKVKHDIQKILNIALAWTETNTSNTPWNIEGVHNDLLGAACRSASVLSQWTMIHLIRHIVKTSEYEGYADHHTHLEAYDPKMLLKIEQDSRESFARIYADDANYKEDFMDLLCNEAAVKRTKMNKVQTWHIGNQFAEVMGVKLPDPEQVAYRKKRRNSGPRF
jgi:hypothetical protein